MAQLPVSATLPFTGTCMHKWLVCVGQKNKHEGWCVGSDLEMWWPKKIAKIPKKMIHSRVICNTRVKLFVSDKGTCGGASLRTEILSCSTKKKIDASGHVIQKNVFWGMPERDWLTS